MRLRLAASLLASLGRFAIRALSRESGLLRERRSGRDRRSGVERRGSGLLGDAAVATRVWAAIDRRSRVERRSGVDRRVGWSAES